MTQTVNPYDPPRQKSDKVTLPNLNASLLWFVVPAFFAHIVGVILQPSVGPRRLQWTISYLGTPILIAAVTTAISVTVYLLAGGVKKRRDPATRLSRIAAALVFCSIVWFVARWLVFAGFSGPPGLISLPLAAIASTFVDRLLAKLAPATRVGHN